MESALPMETGGEVGTVACCECGTSIQPNSANISSVGGFSSHLYIITPANLQHCKFCDRYLVPPNGWLFAALESKELLSLCLKRLKPQLTNVRLVDAAFIWTEPHSKRVKVKLTVQKEVFTNAVLQQTFVVEFVICGQVCEECHRVQAKDYWRACVQVRQKCEFKKTLFTLEQTLLKHDALQQCTSVKPVPTGMDFFFAKQQDARKLLEFINTILPCKYHYSQQLISQDIRNNTFDYKHTYCIDVCPITKDSLICLPKRLAQSYGNLGQMVVCLRVSSVIQLINPQTLQMVELNGLTYFKDPFEILLDPKALVEFYVIEEESIDNYQHPNGHGHISTKHHLSHLFVCRASEVGVPDATIYSAKTHLGNFVTVGDTVFGYDLVNCNVNSDIWDQLSDDEKPDVILVHCRAIHYKNPDLLRELIVANPGILNATRTHDGRSALHYAAIHGSTDCIGVLLDGTEIDVDAVAGITDSLKTSLLLAADLGHLTACRRLVEAGADLFYCDANGYSALQLAQIRNHGRIAEYLFECIDSIRRESQKLRQELCAACTTNNYGQVMTTLSKCTTQNRREILGAGKTDEDGKSALYLACEHGYSEIVRALLTVKDHSTMDTQSGNTVLHAACKSNNFATIQLVFEAFPEQVDVINDEKSLPLHLACEVGNLEAVRLLMSHKYADGLKNVFEKTINGPSYEFGFDLNAANHECRTCLHLAVENGHLEVVKFMLKFRIQLFSLDQNDQLIPTEIGSPLLLDTYAINGRTPLMTAVCNIQTEIVELLLDSGADVNLPLAITDLEVACLTTEEVRCVGSGALIEAALANHLDLLQLLFFHGAVDYDNQALRWEPIDKRPDNKISRKIAKTENFRVISAFLDQLTFSDSENRINTANQSIDRSTPILSAVDRLKSLDLLNSAKPTQPCRLDWHNAGLQWLSVELMSSAAHRLNPRVRNMKNVLMAITRLDLSDNQLTQLPDEIFQLRSLKSLNLDRNKLDELVLPRGEFGCPFLETFNAEDNQIMVIPDTFFDCTHFPNLRTVNLSGNRLRRLPATTWRSPKLHELNVSRNEITDILAHYADDSRSRRDARVRHGRSNATDGAVRRAMERRGGEQRNPPVAAQEEKSQETQRRPSVPVLKSDVIRANIWQNEINIAPVDDAEEPSDPSVRASIRGLETNGTSNSIKILNLSGNKLRTLPDCLACYCPRLIKLDLSNNEISSLRSVECLPPTLKHLNLMQNRLSAMFRRPDTLALHCYAPSSESGSSNAGAAARSRSKSVARNQQRSLSIIRASKEIENHDLCAHKMHCRLENLKTLNLSQNQLQTLDLFIPFETRHVDSMPDAANWKEMQLRSHLIFPVLTNLDVSHNELKLLPSNISLLTQLAVLNLSENRQLEKLPVELGLLEKLWSVSVGGCLLKDPLKEIVASGNFKTMDLLSFLRNELDNSKPYPKLKLMFLGRTEVGKTALLNQLRAEGQTSKSALSNNESWAARIGHSPSRSASKSSFSTKERRALVDVAEWIYEPPKSSKTMKSEGSVTFRTWDFDRLQKDFQQIPQYFMTRRSICLVVWKVTDGEIAINEIHEWLLAIHARAPNTTVIIVGSHLDCVEENIKRFPDNYLENLEQIIQQRFVNIADSDKKGLPKVVASTFVSVKTRFNIQHLCQLIYYAAQQVKTPARRTKLLQEKVPSSFLRLEKLVVKLTDDFRIRNEEPVIRMDALWSRLNNEFQLSQRAVTNSKDNSTTESNGKKAENRLFRNRLQFRQACQFLHENGAIVTFDDTQLRDFCFIDPPWLYTVLRTILSQPQRSTTSLVSTAANSGTTLISTTDLFVQLKANLAQRRIKFSLKHSQLPKFEIALPSFTRTLLISPLLPDEYLLRADYPGAKIRCRSKIDKFRCRQQPSMYQSFTTSSITDSEPAMSSSRYSTARSAHNRLGRSLGFRSHQFASATQSNGETDGLTVDSKEKVEVRIEYKDVYRRIYLMQYVPVGFWPRLTARILNDEKLCNTIAELFVLGEDEEEMGFKSRLSNDCALFCEVNDALNGETSDDRKGGFDFLLWQTGIEVRLFGEYICSLKQFLPLANVRDTNYSMADLHRRSDDLQWRRLSIANEFVVELLIPLMDMNLTWKGMDYRVRTCEKQATRFLASLVGIVDDLLEDWFPALGTRFVHTSDGQLLVDRLITCNQCAQMQQQEEKQWRRERKTSDPTRKTAVYLFSVEECILEVHDQQNQRSKLRNECPIHGQQDVAKLAPDIVFSDLAVDFVYEPHNVKKGKLIGSGAFGCVYSGYARSRLDVFDEVALKVLQQNGNTQFERPMLVDTSDRLETIARSYCVARQELNLLGDLEHTNITLLIGFSRPPITLLMELAPHGALDQMLSRYKRSELRLQWSTLQQTCGQVSKALEFLHSHHIIYRDLKAENVLVWKFPLPHGKSTNSAVQVKLGDYGISRFSYPSDVCKGYGGTEGFMAPEILRYNGEFEYTEKVDCYSFGIFIYELISLRHPFDNQDQMKDCIFEGQRPLVSEKDILCPTNVLDLMVACWSENAANRPSSSELVTITSAPEFTNLSDVAVLSGGEMSQVAAVIVGNNDELSSQLSPQCWLSRADGTFTVLNFNQFGFIDAETVGPLKTSQWTAIAEVGGHLWLGNAIGEISVFCVSSNQERASFHVETLDTGLQTSDLPINSSPYESRTIRSIGWFAERSVLLITLPHAVLLCSRPQGGILPQWLATVRSEEFVNASTLLHSASDYQLWTAHDEARVVMHHLAGSTHRLLYSASASHSNRPEDGKRVKFLVPSRQSYGHAWSSLENDGRVFMWENGVIRRTLDCSKILPVSESLSSMTIFDEEENEVNGKEATIDEENIRLRSGIGGKRSRITALAVYQTNLCVEQLVVGTSLGVIIILECKTLSPLTSFRTYTSAVETILCANSQKPSGRQSKTNDEPGFAADSYFVTIGRRYRNLIKRLALNVCDSTEQPEDANFAVVWQGDQWRT
ncbi:Protein kinase domain containing protein [Aphelenchoides besseyi]|nr:Protein kinase domain containing protein [Aphelenchoides besseyi]